MVRRLVQLLLLVGLERAVGHGVCDAGQHEAVVDLLVVKEGLVSLVDLTRLQQQSKRVS